MDKTLSDVVIVNLVRLAGWGYDKVELPPLFGSDLLKAAEVILQLRSELDNEKNMGKDLEEWNERIKEENVQLEGRIEDLEKECLINRVQLKQYNNLRRWFTKLVELMLGEDYYNEAMDVYKADEFCCRDIWHRYGKDRENYSYWNFGKKKE